MTEKLHSFGRIYHLAVNLPTSKDEVLEFDPETYDPNTEEYISSYGQIEITDYRVNVVAKQSALSSSAGSTTSSVNIYNLPKGVIDLIRGKGNSIVFRAGYLSEQNTTDLNYLKNLPEILKGEIVKTKVTYTGRDKILMLTVSSGASERKTKVLSTKLLQGTLVTDGIREICKPLTEDGNLVVDIQVGKTMTTKLLERTVNFSTIPFEALDKFLGEYGLVGALVNDEIKVREKQNILVRQESILIDPTRIINGVDFSTDYTKSDNNSEDGLDVDFTMFLDTRVTINTYIDIQVDNVIGTFKVNAINFKLDTHSSSWYMDISGSSIYKTDLVTTDKAFIDDGTVFA